MLGVKRLVPMIVQQWRRCDVVQQWWFSKISVSSDIDLQGGGQELGEERRHLYIKATAAPDALAEVRRKASSLSDSDQHCLRSGVGVRQGVTQINEDARS